MASVSEISTAVRRARQAHALLVTAGAGMGVDSGLPDFRGDAGFWRAYPPLQRVGVRFADMAQPSWFTSDPHLAWGFYGHRLRLYRTTAPHAGFRTLRHLSGEFAVWVRRFLLLFRAGLFSLAFPLLLSSICALSAESRPGGSFVFTSNVDGHFQRTGFNEARVIECHGSINHKQCTDPRCSRSGGITPMDEAVAIDDESLRALDPLPRCECGKVVRPNIL
jgi:NAD-dependent SIR2 family protein deacetylase